MVIKVMMWSIRKVHGMLNRLSEHNISVYDELPVLLNDLKRDYKIRMGTIQYRKVLSTLASAVIYCSNRY